MSTTTLRRKIILTGIFTFILLFGLLALSVQLIVLDGFVTLEQQSILDDLRRTLDLFQNELQKMGGTAQDWAIWDETYEFMNSRSREYLESNLIDATYVSLDLNLIMYVTPNRESIVAEAFDLENETKVAIPPDLAQLATRYEFLVPSEEETELKSGVIQLDDGSLWMLVAHPILTSDGTGPNRGVFIIGRMLDDSVLQRISALAQLMIEVHPLNTEGLRPALESARVYLQNQTLPSTEQNRPLEQHAPTSFHHPHPVYVTAELVEGDMPDLITGHTVIQGLDGQPLLLLSSSAPRTIYQQGVRIVRYIYLAFFSIVGIVIGGTLMLMRGWVLKPLLRLSQSVNQIGRSGDLTQRVPEKGDKEFSMLAKDINATLVALELAQRRAQQYRTVVEKAPEGVVLINAHSHQLVESNLAFRQLLGYSAKEILSLHSYEILAKQQEEVFSEFQKLQQNGDGTAREFRYLHKNGQLIDVETSTIFLQGGEDSLYCLIARDITARKRAEQALLDTIPDNIVRMDRNGTYLDVRLTTDTPWPFTANELTGRNLFEMLSAETANLIWNRIHAALHTGKIQSLEYERELNGEKHYLESRIGASGENEVVTIVRNVTARRKAEETIRYQASLVQNLSDAIVSTDMYFMIKSWNRAAEELYNLTSDEVIGKPFNHVVNLEFPDQDWEGMFQILEREGSWKGEQIHHRKDGVSLNMFASISYVLDSEGNRTGTVGVYRDITERKRSEQLLLLAQKSESLNLLAGGIAHDFNNLLTGILAQTSLALHKLSEDNRARTHIEKAVKSTERAADLTRQLLAYTGQGAFLTEAIDLNQLIRDNLGLLEAILPKDAELILQLAPDLAAIEIDRGHAQQIAMNLVINATEAIDEEEGHIYVETGQTTLTDDETSSYIGNDQLTPGNYVYLQVSDNGTGMDEQTLARIFDPYYTTKETGSGLGLSATLGIVQRYKGGLRVESQPNMGTTFTLLFPATEAVVSVSHEQTQEVEAIGGVVLVVDDEEPVRQAIADILMPEGVQVIHADNGYDGLEKFKHHRSEIDLVLLDMRMPIMNGEETFHELRKVDKQINIVLSSGYNEEAKQVQKDQSTTFLQKPYNNQVLLNTIRQALKRSKGQHIIRRAT